MPGRTKLRQGQTQTSKEEGGSTSRTTAQIEKYYSGGKREFTYKKNDRGKVIKVELKGGGMSSGQAAIAAKAPPPNVLNGKDLAVLRAEKAKGRGMGLQDEKVKPGKVKPVKAVLGLAAMGLMGAKYLKDKNKKATPMIGATAELMKKKKEILGKKMGGVMKYKRGSGLDLPVISSVKTAVHKTKRAQNLANYKIQFNKQRSRAGANPNSHFDKKNANVVKHTRVSGSPVASKFTERRMKLAGPFSSMAEMRKAKGFKPGESASEFNKRRKILAGVTKAASATKIGKIALAVGTAGVAAQQYLKSKMNKKKEVKKKMSGGSIKKYSEGMSYKDMAPYGGKYAKIKKDMSDKASENVKRLTTQSDAYDPETRYVTASQRKGNSRRRRTTKTTDQVYLKGVANKMKEDMGSGTSTSILTPSQARERRIIRPERKRALSRIKTSKFNIGGMTMMQQPIGFKSGTMVKARGCKLGRTRPTKIT